MKNPPDISVVIPTYNRCSLLKECLQSLEKQTYPCELFEVIVVDDGSHDETPMFLKEFTSRSNLKLLNVRQENKGPAAARNAGIRLAQGDRIVFIDDDCLPTPDWLKEITSGYSNNVGGMGGRILPMQSNTWIGRYCHHKRIHETPAFKDGSIDYLITANASFSRKALVEAEGFDEQYRYPGGEDPDLSRRIRALGYVLTYNEAAIVYHRHRETLGTLIRTYYRYGVGESISYRKRKAGRSPIVNQIARVYGMVWYLSAILLSVVMIPVDAARYYRDHLMGIKPFMYAGIDFVRRNAFRLGMVTGYYLQSWKK
jgi:glycosyltransferase involved in cell wall biosynthesis